MGTVFLDLDGTLTDPAEGITRCVIHALDVLGLPAPPPDALTWVIGPPLIDSFAKLGAPDPATALMLYRERFSTIGLFENIPYPGVEEVVSRLAERHRLCLATAKPKVYAERITRKFGLNRHFFAEFGPDLDGTLNDKADLLADALAQLGETPENCVMVGDRHHDIDAARAVGMASVAVTWGYGSREEHREADAICTALAELPDVIETTLMRAR